MSYVKNEMKLKLKSEKKQNLEYCNCNYKKHKLRLLRSFISYLSSPPNLKIES